jgi:hypothetical protein
VGGIKFVCPHCYRAVWEIVARRLGARRRAIAPVTSGEITNYSSHSETERLRLTERVSTITGEAVFQRENLIVHVQDAALM